MSAIVTDQFRINNAGNFLGDVNNSANSYYVFVGLSNPSVNGVPNAFGRNESDAKWNDQTTREKPVDNINYLNHVRDTMIFGKKITSENVRRVVRKITWTKDTTYDMYRHDYSSENQAPNGKTSRLYDSNFYVINKDFNVYICIDNGSSGINTTGNASLNEPTLTGLEPFRATGATDDGYLWKYLFTVAPSDIIKFDATEFIPLPNDWSTSTDANIANVRDSGNSDINNNQIKKVYIADGGTAYTNAGAGGIEVNIIGDGSGGKAIVEVGTNTKINDVQVSVGGKGYTYGVLDLTDVQPSSGANAKLIPIIPPAKGHGSDIYKELGADRVLVYARFDDSTKDFPIDTKFAQIGIVKNPTSIGSTQIYDQTQYSSISSLYLKTFPSSSDVKIGDLLEQDVKDDGVVIGKVKAYVTSFDIISNDSSNPIAVMKYSRDRSLYFNQSTGDQQDQTGISTSAGSNGQVYDFSDSLPVTGTDGSSSYTVGINSTFSGITTNPTGTKVIDLGVEFKNGLSQSEINNQSGDIIYLDNRQLITRDSRQKEDIKVILEF
tara:strand:- start:6166 stop:7812 length:1647 start_codon:yes stop_codon:yes gene_type:complete